MDWQKLINELIASGMTQAEIGTTTQLSQPTISDLSRGAIKDLRWAAGERLRRLHAERFQSGAVLAGSQAKLFVDDQKGVA